MADCNRKCNHQKLTVTNSGQFREGFGDTNRELNIMNERINLPQFLQPLEGEKLL